ncbi:MAG TPA: hypothetical protein PKW66_23395, partial [Polyangiaceae bacterium]|nr:hypothetical protein [Polyangiaceae bacterium]
MSATEADIHLTPALTPLGRLILVSQDDVPALDPVLATRIREAFERGSGHGLWHLGAAVVGQALPPA